MDVTSVELIQEYIVPVTMAFCWCIGIIIRKWVKDVDNKFIPTICAVSGLLFNCWVENAVSPTIVLAGMASGLAATGLDQLMKSIR